MASRYREFIGYLVVILATTFLQPSAASNLIQAEVSCEHPVIGAYNSFCINAGTKIEYQLFPNEKFWSKITLHFRGGLKRVDNSKTWGEVLLTFDADTSNKYASNPPIKVGETISCKEDVLFSPCNSFPETRLILLSI